MGNDIVRPELEQTVYTKEDFILGTAPYEEVYKLRDNPFEYMQAEERMSIIAKACGVSNFKKTLKAYCQAMRAASGDVVDNASDFEDQEIDLSTGSWYADEYGVRRINSFGIEEVACVHPIMPVKRLVNIDTGIEKLEIAYKKAKKWRKKIFERRMLASASSIVALSDYGVAVTSENAKLLVTYLHDVENLNYDRIEESNSVGRLGWIGDEGFSPYVDGLVYDGNSSFQHFYDSVSQRGSAENWIEFVSKIRKEGNVATKIVLAASFASVLVEPCNCLPFFVHLWNGSGNGKTVALMLAASVWANPQVGEYIHTFNATDVGQELSAGFVNSLPLILDELQIQKDRRDFDKTIYKLSEGVGRTRGAKAGGVQAIPTWRNCILTNGEDPILSANSGGGAVNRIIEINTDGTQFFKDARAVADFVTKNYGHAGRMFVEKLMDEDIMAEARDDQRTFFKTLSGKDITDKQVLAASLILAADVLIERYIFKDGAELNVNDVTKFLSTHDEVSANVRAMEWLDGWIAQNGRRFDENNKDECWGKDTNSDIRIIKQRFDLACCEAGFNPTSFLTFLRRNDKLDTEGRALTKRVRINGRKCQCVVLKKDMDDMGFEEIDENEQVAF